MSVQGDEKFRECGWRTLEIFFFPLCMWPWCISCLHLRACPHSCKESLFCAQVLLKLTVLRPRKWQRWLSVSFSAWHSSPHLAPHKCKPGKHNMRYHLDALSAWRIITSWCCSHINDVCKPCMETLSPQTFSQGTYSFQHTNPKQGVSRDLVRLGPSLGASSDHPPF